MKLKEMAEIHAGYPFRGRIQELKKGAIGVVQMRNINLGGGIAWGNLVRTEIKGRRQHDLLAADDILFAAKGTQNYAYHIQQVPDQCVASPHFYQIRVIDKQKILPEFLAWQINQRTAKAYFTKSAEGSTTLSIRRSVLEDLIIQVPPVETQAQAIRLYRCFVKERDLTNKLMENRQKQITATLEHYLANF